MHFLRIHLDLVFEKMEKKVKTSMICHYLDTCKVPEF